MAHSGKNLALMFCILFSQVLFSQKTPFQWIDENKLVINDGISEQTYWVENNRLKLLTAKPLTYAGADSFSSASADLIESKNTKHTLRNTFRMEATERTSAYTQLDLTVQSDSFEYVRSMRVYDDCPGVEWRLKMRGTNTLFGAENEFASDLIEDASLLGDNVPYYFSMPFASPHYSTKIVSFKEATDHHSNIVSVQKKLPYKKSQYYKGNMLIASENGRNITHLIVKLSPLHSAQSAYAGFDFSTDFTGTKVHSPGFEFTENQSGWQEAYPVYSLMYAPDEETALNLYKKYELTKHKYLPKKDNTFTMNTWGDRNRDSRVNEKFILNELDAASRLGVTHFQIDDGWQQGLSQNSSSRAGILWDDWSADDWEVNSIRFPNGLKPIAEKANSLNMQLGLWFNPSKKDNYAAWERDKSILTELNKKHNISWIKIDGLGIGNKESETNVLKMLQGAINESGQTLQFNMDVTAGKRGGYFFLNDVGNIFLENRYTDWGNYYPHLTLRNVWTLSKYIPVQRIQVEWLNKWRNEKAYPANDPLKPINVPFDYQFAITMMGQPLAWMEATALPEEAFGVSSLISTWKKERSRMQRGIIHPIGDEPTGYGFPGFVSYAEGRVYVLLFRENSAENHADYTLPLRGGIEKQKFTRLAGEGNLLKVQNNTLQVSFLAPFQFLWGYFE